MDKRKRQNTSVIRLERNMSYRFPAIVAFFSLFLGIASYSILNLVRFRLRIDLYLPSNWNTTAATEELTASIPVLSAAVSVNAFFNCLYIIMAVIPLLVAFNFANGFTNGQFRTLMSYPIGRNRLVLIKAGFVVVLVSASVIIGGVVSTAFYYPFLIDYTALLLLSISFCVTVYLITTACLLISVITKSAPVTAFIGIGVWVVAFIIITSPSIFPMLGYTLYPFVTTADYIHPGLRILYSGNVTMLDALLGNALALILGTLLLYISMRLFNRLEL
ncbi:MAG: hypothetical protein RTU30_03500 [Candidatus Thorarchaeota archaeon]